MHHAKAQYNPACAVRESKLVDMMADLHFCPGGLTMEELKGFLLELQPERIEDLTEGEVAYRGERVDGRSDGRQAERLQALIHALAMPTRQP